MSANTLLFLTRAWPSLSSWALECNEIYIFISDETLLPIMNIPNLKSVLTQFHSNKKYVHVILINKQCKPDKTT
jgi:hypothetical protein